MKYIFYRFFKHDTCVIQKPKGEICQKTKTESFFIEEIGTEVKLRRK